MPYVHRIQVPPEVWFPIPGCAYEIWVQHHSPLSLVLHANGAIEVSKPCMIRPKVS